MVFILLLACSLVVCVCLNLCVSNILYFKTCISLSHFLNELSLIGIAMHGQYLWSGKLLGVVHQILHCVKKGRHMAVKM